MYRMYSVVIYFPICRNPALFDDHRCGSLYSVNSGYIAYRQHLSQLPLEHNNLLSFQTTTIYKQDLEIMTLQTHIHVSSEQGLSSITTLIVGSKSAALIDPPFLIPDAKSIVKWIKDKTSLPLKAVFVTHHHPDHFFSANPILEAFPDSRFLAAPYVRAGIDREYEEKVKYWPSVMGKEMVPEQPRKPDVFEHSFFVLDGDEQSPICLLGPVQGDSVDQTLFWLPTEKTIVCGDVIYARSTHVW